LKVLIVEDEIAISKPMANVLKKHNYTVELADDGETGLFEALSGCYDLILLDIMLPKMDGLEILNQIRKAGLEAPIIMLTARSQIEDKIAGLDGGADDYLPKPFVYAELLARMRALIRRGSNIRGTNALKMGNLELDMQSLNINVQGTMKLLPKKEAQLLELLMVRGQAITPKELIVSNLWEFEKDVMGNNVEYHISSLRKKMKTLNSNIMIKNIRGVGYVLQEEK